MWGINSCRPVRGSHFLLEEGGHPLNENIVIGPELGVLFAFDPKVETGSSRATQGSCYVADEWLCVLLVSVVGCSRRPLREPISKGPTTQLRADQSVIPRPPIPLRRFTKGEAIYIRYCADCHGWQGQGAGPVSQALGRTPPALNQTALFARATDDELIGWILLGKELTIPLSEVAFPETEAEVTLLVRHVRSLPSIPWQQVKDGQDIYDELCIACHGIYGRGDGTLASSLPFPPRDLNTPPYQSQVSDEALMRIIAEGKGAMPGASEVLTDKDIRAVVAFVRLLSPGFEHYDRFCAICHGRDGRPTELVPQDIQGFSIDPSGIVRFDASYFETQTDEQLRVWVRHMLKESRTIMPHFAGQLNAEEVRQILAYLRTLPQESLQEGIGQ